MLNKYFNQLHNSGSSISITTVNGEVLHEECDANIGILKGPSRSINAILCDGAFADDPWHVFNMTSNGVFKGHYAVRGAVSVEQSTELVQRYLAPMMADSVISNIEQLSDQGMNNFLETPSTAMKTPYLLCDNAVEMNQRLTKTPCEWDEDAGLLSHNGQMSGVIFDMMRHDADQELLEQMSVQDIAAYVIGDGTVAMNDAMIIKYRQLEKTMNKLAEAMKDVTDQEFHVVSVTQIQPFKKNGVVNVGIIFEMTDTQTVTVLFNNPDTTPGKITPDDVLTSWKWILNKRDVTAALQPRAVESKKYAVIAKRMMKLLISNHARFVRGQGERLRIDAEIESGKQAITDKQNALQDIQNQILEVQAQIDAKNAERQEQTEVGKIDNAGTDSDDAQPDEVLTEFLKIAQEKEYEVTNLHDYAELNINGQEYVASKTFIGNDNEKISVSVTYKKYEQELMEHGWMDNALSSLYIVTKNEKQEFPVIVSSGIRRAIDHNGIKDKQENFSANEVAEVFEKIENEVKDKYLTEVNHNPTPTEQAAEPEPETPPEQAAEPEVNPLYQSIIDGNETVSIKLLQQLKGEAANNPDDPMLQQALEVLLSQMNSLVSSGTA